jgi:hypothetical protein
MKSLLRASILLFAATLLPVAGAQDTPPQGPPRGMGQGAGSSMGGAFADHGVRGTVTAVSGNDITVKTEQGDTYKIQTGPNTRFRKQRDRSQAQTSEAGAANAQIKISDIHVGDMVGAFGDKDDKAKTVGAMMVMVIDKEQYEKARADFGKTWTAGAIQSIDETKITVKRPDNVIQTIVVDENTSFRKRRDSITLADIKVGDNVSAQGSLQNGNFVATVLNVGGPGGQGAGRGAGVGVGQGVPGGPGASVGNHGATTSQPAPASATPAPQNQ